ncbi:PB1 domain [Dillenia turbinata]|uniref:PB1 domain n=1 Tax=Dillenia turbinata TaxID=194707 RepID=A0AAN8VIU7_9MAGN
MNSHHQIELDRSYNASSPRADHPHRPHDDFYQRVRFMCSFGGRILPRPHDNQLRYVGGETRIVVVNRSINFLSLLTKLAKLSGTVGVTVKYQLPNEDLDALISVTSDEDVENMFDEYDRLVQQLGSKTARLRLFLFLNGGEESRASSISSLLDGSAKREHWFLDALNGGEGLERGPSEASSMVSEVPDYLFGLDTNLDEQREPKVIKSRHVLADSVSASDPGSPAPDGVSPFCSTSSAPVPTMPDLPPVKTKLDNSRTSVKVKEISQSKSPVAMERVASLPAGYPGNPSWGHYPTDPHYSGNPSWGHYPTDPSLPVYYIPGPGPVPVQVATSNIPVHPAPVRARQFVQRYPMAPPAHVPVGFGQPVPATGQVYSGEVKAVPVATMEQYEVPGPVLSVNQQMYYGVRNPGMLPVYSGVMHPVGEKTRGPGMDPKSGGVL